MKCSLQPQFACCHAIQDLDYDAAVPLYVNRRFFIEFLHERVFLRKHSNILEDFLYVTFTSVQYVAMARANALVDVLISRPLRWLSGERLRSFTTRKSALRSQTL